MAKATDKTVPITKINPLKIKSLTFLLNNIEEEHIDLKIPKHALLIGAGCSLQCGIPLGGELIELCKMHSFLKEEVKDSRQLISECRINKKDIEQKLVDKKLTKKYEAYIKSKDALMMHKVEEERELHTKRLREFLKDSASEMSDDELWSIYKDSIVADSSYGFWMNYYNENPQDRQRFIEEIMDNKLPDGAYIILSYLIEKRRFTNVLTTNFDDLINEAVMYYTEQRCRFYVDDELSQYISIHNQKPNIIKLHGDYRFANMKNTILETENLTKNINLKLGELLRHLGVVVAGYNGADYSIMSVLQEHKEHNKYPLIWCGMDGKNVHWRVAHLINNTENSYFVEINGFDWLMGQLAIAFLSSIPDIEEKAKEKKKAVDAFLEKFKITFKASATSEDEAAELVATFDKWEELNKARRERDWTTIISLETAVIDSGNANAKDFSWRGWAYRNLGENSLAIADYTKSISLDESSAVVYNNRGYVYRMLRDYEKAISDYNTAIVVDPNLPLAYINRGYVYNELNEYDKAIADFNKAIQIDAKEATTFKHRSSAYVAKGEYDIALLDLNKAIELKPGYWEAYEARAELNEQLGNSEKAEQDRAKAKELKEKEEKK